MEQKIEEIYYIILFIFFSIIFVYSLRFFFEKIIVFMIFFVILFSFFYFSDSGKFTKKYQEAKQVLNNLKTKEIDIKGFHQMIEKISIILINWFFEKYKMIKKQYDRDKKINILEFF